MSVQVELLVDHSKDSIEARRLLYDLHRRYPEVNVEGIPANGDDLPIAFCYGFIYRGLDRIIFLRDKLVYQIHEERNSRRWENG